MRLNLITTSKQLLRLKARDDNLAVWLKRKQNVYTSPDAENNIIRNLGHHVLQSITEELQSSPFLTVNTKFSIFNCDGR